jgi:hypothetical protein
MKIKFAFKPDKPNINKVIFTKRAIENEVKDYLQRIERYGEIGQPESNPDEDTRAFIIQDITFNGKEFVADIDILDNENGDKLKEMIEGNEDDYRIVTLSRTEVADLIESSESITINKMKFLNIGIINKSQVF